MKNITEYSDCRKCSECCKFRKDEIYFAPVFANEEFDKLGSDSEKVFFEQRGTAKQVRLAKLNDEFYVCPFYNSEKELCSIYQKRPFDCRIYPFLVAKKNGKIYLTAFRDACPSLEKKSEDEIVNYAENLKNWLQEEKQLRFFERNPDVIWPVDDDQTIVCELDKLSEAMSKTTIQRMVKL
ncbi:MAG TPA: YkgJ family cysteine cluster protein [Candidatus Nanoarchaeia archaeon]|nr:YkgJ family cysteine cluster protein [Candidatus Nanoarchaeia archaeon]